MPYLQGKPGLFSVLLYKVVSGDMIRLNLTKKDVMLENYYDSFITIPILIDDQALNFVVDTGSSKTLVISDRTIWNGRPCDGTFFGLYECKQPAMCDDREPLSGTFVHGARTEFIRHEGYVNFGTQNVLRMEFGIVKKFTDAKGAARSILGLSLKYLPGYPAPFLDQLLTKGAIKHKEFSMYFDPEHMNRGELLLGGGDSAKYHGELVALPLADENGWIVKLNSIKITGMSLLEESYPIIIDSGTDFLIVPEKVSDAITAHIRDSARAVGAEVESSNNGLLRILGCKGRANLPNIELTFEGLRGKNNFNLVLSQEVYLNELSDGHCVLLITAIPGNRKLIMALTFLRSYYINFNKEKHQIRIAKTIKRSQKGAPPPTLRTCCNIGIYLKPAIKRNTFRSPCLTIQILIYNCDMIPHTQSYHTMIKCATKNIAD